mgnify:CR=1 FL=1
MSDKTIPIRCKGSKTVPFESLKPFQGNLKEMNLDDADKLRAEIVERGWIAPIFVWNDQIMDGHGRLYVLGQMLEDGYSIGELPVAEIDAKDETEAAKILLAINSHYQKITDDGLYEFVSRYNIKALDLENLELPDIDLGQFKHFYLDDKDEWKTKDDIEVHEEFNVEVNFMVKCENMAELEKLRDCLDVTGMSIPANDLMEMVQVNA